MVQKCIDLNEIEKEDSLNTALFNIFRLVNHSITVPIFEEQDYINDFWDLLSKMAEKFPDSAMIKKNIAGATNT